MRLAASIIIVFASVLMLAMLAGIEPLASRLLGMPCFVLVTAQLALASGLVVTHWRDA